MTRSRRSFLAPAILLATLPLVHCKPQPAATASATEINDTRALPLAPKELRVELRGPAQGVAFEPIALTLQSALERSFDDLGRIAVSPYFLAYQVVDRDAIEMSASDGALISSSRDASRTLDVDLRIGSKDRDHTHRISGEDRALFKSLHPLPLESHGPALVNTLWLATDLEYDQALSRWLRVQAIDPNDEKPTTARADFSAESAIVHAEPKLTTTLDTISFEQRLRALSRVALEYPEVQRSHVALSVTTENRYLVNTEGTRLQVPQRAVRLEFQAQTIASDGMLLDRFDSVDVRALEQLPGDEELLQRFRSLFEDLKALAKAPTIEPYVGPAILDGKAAGVFFHEVFGHRVEGHRQDDESEGQTFADMVGQPIMLPTLDVYDDPTAFKLNGTELNGFYLFDDEGVAAQRASLVKDGVLEGFLLSRTPARDFTRSNGHGRREPGHVVVARQANLIIDPSETVSRETLLAALLAEVARQGLPYGLRFSEISGGFTQTQRYNTQAFKVIPVMVYKVYPDGRQELVRGVDIEGTPLTALSKITAVANDFQVFNGLCGAESGWVPVSATSPSVLLSQIEVARQEQMDLKAPLLPPPSTRWKRDTSASAEKASAQ